MSLEALITELTQAVKENTAALKGVKPAAAIKAVKVEAATQAQPVNPPQTAGVSVKQVADALVKLAEKDREKAVTLLGKFGAKKVPELKPENYEQFIKEAQTIMTQLEAPAAAPGNDLI